jgi:glucose/arabinose dehydrogenase
MSQVSSCNINSPLNGALLPAGFCAGILPVRIQQPRTIISIGESNFLALERGTESVVVAEDLDGDGIPESIRPLISNFVGLNHGLEITSAHLYASNSSHVYRWSYNPTEVVVSGNPQLVVTNINADGMGGAPQGHRTRTLAIDRNESILYVSVGSNANIDPDSFRSRIRRFPITDETLFPFDFLKGEVFADGLRNEVALEFAPDGTLWGAMNAADRLYHSTLGGDIHDNNPAEEVHRFATAGQNYGYPYCWREYDLPLGLGRGTAWAWPNASLLSTVFTDGQCRSNFDTPALMLQAHSAPLGMTFYQYLSNRSSLCDGIIPFPETMDGHAFVAFHGSWNREIPTGYKVVYFPTTSDWTGVVGGLASDPTDLLAHNGTSAQWTMGLRPVDVAFDACGRLLLSSDGSRDGNDTVYGDYVIRIESIQQASLAPAPISPEPSSAPLSPKPSSTILPATRQPTEAPTKLNSVPISPPTSSEPISPKPSSIAAPTTSKPFQTPTMPSSIPILPSNTTTSDASQRHFGYKNMLVTMLITLCLQAVPCEMLQ